MQYVLAIDGGGTKTHIWCADETGKILGEGVSGPASLVVSPPEVALQNVKTAAAQAMVSLPPGEEISCVFMGLAGVDIPQEISEAKAIFSPLWGSHSAVKLHIVNDVEIALASASTAPNAIALISGTGSNCFGHNAQGKTAKASGFDYLMSDQGCGYSLGVGALKAAVKSFDGRGLKTILESLVCQHFQVATIPELKLKIYHPPLSKTQLAQLAKLVEVAANQQDAVAIRLFDELVRDLIEMVMAVAVRLSVTETEVECVVVGGMMRVPYIQSHLETRLRARLPKIKIIKPTQSPVSGALQLALAELKRL